MKPIASLATLLRCSIAFALLLALAPTAATSAQVAAPRIAAAPLPGSNQPAPPAATAAASGGCQWTYYPVLGGVLQPPQPLYNDPNNTPILDLSLGNLFKGKATPLASRGSTDFNGDNKTDVFRTFVRGDGSLQWQYSSAGTGPWQDLAFADPAPLQFGQFNADALTDVFASVDNGGTPPKDWDLSAGGTNSFITLNTRDDPDRLALGDFNGDGVTDVFTASQSGSSEQWGYFPGGTGGPLALAHDSTSPALLRFGDFNGDGKTDVFAADQNADGSTPWHYSSGGAFSYLPLITTTVPYSELRFGDFNGDGKTDVLAALPQNDGRLKVVDWLGGLGAAHTLGFVGAPAPALRVGDFNGDGTDDLLALRCGMGAPAAFGPLQTLANSGYGTFIYFLGGNDLAGDVNGDGRDDVILVSTCQDQNALYNCASHPLQLGVALATPAQTFSLAAPQTLSPTVDFYRARAFAGDFSGDGKTDVALVIGNFGTLTITLATSNGNGLFTLGAPQVFGGESNWGSFNPIVGDFNHDGKDDLALTTVCNTVSLFTGSCSNGTTNSVYMATSNGAGFGLGPRQDLSLTPQWDDYYAFAGDFNGDGRTDLVFDSTCQNVVSFTCTTDANLMYTALASGSGTFTLGAPQTYGSTGWSDYPVQSVRVGDLNGDGRSDLVWSSAYQAAGPTNNNLVVVGLSNGDGTFAREPNLDFGSAWSGTLSLADLNRDGRADLVWNDNPLSDADVDTFAVATSNGNGTFTSRGTGAVYTGPGYFSLPAFDAPGRVPTSLTLVSTRQDSISNALFMVTGFVRSLVYLPLLRR